MATKVKGESIKEGSIPLSALSDDVMKYSKYGLYNYYGTLGNGVTEITINGIKRGVVVCYNNEMRYIETHKTAQLDKLFNGPPASLSFDDKDGNHVLSILDNNNQYVLDIFGGYSPLYADWNSDDNINGISGMVKIDNRTHFTSRFIYDKTVDNTIVYVGNINVRTNDVYIRDYIANKYVKLSNTDATNVWLPSGLDNTEYLVSYNRIDNTVSIHSKTTDAIDPYNNLKSLDIVAVVKLEDIYIPDTIARKSEVQGFDPVVWKYICNPLLINNYDICPDELLDDKGNLKYKIPSMYIVHYSGEYCGPISSVDDRFMYTLYNKGTWYKVELTDDKEFRITS